MFFLSHLIYSFSVIYGNTQSLFYELFYELILNPKLEFLYHLFEQQGLIRSGYYLDRMAEEIQNFIPDYVVNYYRGDDAIQKKKLYRKWLTCNYICSQ